MGTVEEPAETTYPLSICCHAAVNGIEPKAERQGVGQWGRRVRGVGRLGGGSGTAKFLIEQHARRPVDLTNLNLFESS